MPIKIVSVQREKQEVCTLISNCNAIHFHWSTLTIIVARYTLTPRITIFWTDRLASVAARILAEQQIVTISFDHLRQLENLQKQLEILKKSKNEPHIKFAALS